MNMIKSTWEQNLRHIPYQLNPNTKKVAKKLEKKQKKIMKKECPIVFN